ncbi:unnamed protein product [Mytilus coruscus]|uniref:Uncharacterized protein n=1 Tax=Mytilus coruscus TaxID=42192 RepID=A0A6J8AVZ2_MYTCO|nr:unnamed protein product [Mytilus coruscus]
MWETRAHEQGLPKQPEFGKLKQADVKGHTLAKILDPDRNYPWDKGNANLACNIKSAKTEVIPAGHEKIIELVAKGRGEIMTTNYVGIIESKLKQTNEKPVLLVRSLVTSQNLIVPLRVANFSSEDVTTNYKNTTLGIFSTIDEDFDKDMGVCGAVNRSAVLYWQQEHN